MTDDPAVDTDAHSGQATIAAPPHGVLPAAPASTLSLSSSAAAAVPGRRRWPLLGDGAGAVSREGTASWPRRWLLLGGAGAVVAAVAAALALLPGGDPAPTSPSDVFTGLPAHQNPSGGASPSPGAAGEVGEVQGELMVDVPRPPAATGEAAAEAGPGRIGRPLVLHLSVDRLPSPSFGVTYQQLVRERQESLTFHGSTGAGDRLAGTTDGLTGTTDQLAGTTVRVGVTTQGWEPQIGAPTPVTVAGRPAVLTSSDGTTVIRWQDADGLWLQVVTTLDEPRALVFATGVRLDRAYRCVVPYRLTNLPDGMHADRCTMTFLAGETHTILDLTDGTSDLRLTSVPQQAPARLPAMDTTIGGHPARLSERTADGRRILEVTVDEGAGVLRATASGAYDAGVVRWILDDCVWTGGNTVAAWPASPLP
ncbi:hypothetical protein [Dactylosporangium sp. NPDC006015]|uniref:hypothetical protein n=1 Tax=Dactylosporangium sp. NPDC006015 TaxID=3154576 RepID=UPI0033B9AA17